MTPYKIFVTHPIPDIGLNMLRDKGYEVLVNEDAKDRDCTKEELTNGIKGASAIITQLTDHITKEVLDLGSPSLKIVANYAVGFNNIDIEEAKKRNILTSNTPGVLTSSTAEHAITLLMATARRIPEADRYVRNGKFQYWGPMTLLGSDIAEKTLGIIGLGRIGSRVAHIAEKGLDMKIVYSDPNPDKEFESEHNAKYYDNIDEMLPVCDFVTLHVPLLDSTKHLINEARLKLMKKEACIINTSRGPIIDEKALVEALKNNIIKGAGLDVFENEPSIEPDLLLMENVVLTPHIASGTEKTRNEMSKLVAINIIEALEERTPPNLVK